VQLVGTGNSAACAIVVEGSSLVRVFAVAEICDLGEFDQFVLSELVPSNAWFLR